MRRPWRGPRILAALVSWSQTYTSWAQPASSPRWSNEPEICEVGGGRACLIVPPSQAGPRRHEASKCPPSIHTHRRRAGLERHARWGLILSLGTLRLVVRGLDRAFLCRVCLSCLYLSLSAVFSLQLCHHTASLEKRGSAVVRPQFGRRQMGTSRACLPWYSRLLERAAFSRMGLLCKMLSSVSMARAGLSSHQLECGTALSCPSAGYACMARFCGRLTGPPPAQVCRSLAGQSDWGCRCAHAQQQHPWQRHTRRLGPHNAGRG